MSEQQGGRPPVPEGVNATSGASSPRPENGIVLGNGPRKKAGREVPAWAGCVLCALGSAAAYIAQPAASLLVGIGALAAGAGKPRWTKVLLGVCTLALAAAGGAWFGVGAVPDALIACVVGLGTVALIESQRMTPGVACIAVVLAAAAHIGSGEAMAAGVGTTLSAQVMGMVSDFGQNLAAASGLAAADLATVEHVVGLIWPVVYLTVALLEFLFAYAGVALAARRLQEPEIKLPVFAEFDLPLWVVALFVAAIAGLAANLTVPAASGDAVLMVVGNLLLSLRYALAAQGFAVLVWLMSRRRRASGLAYAVALAAGAYLEAQFIVMSVVGLLDVWSNFRRLPRGKKVTVQDEPTQD